MRTGEESFDTALSPYFWDRVSKRYDRQLWLEQESVRRLLELVTPAPHQRLLDIGTGTGAVLRQLAALPSSPSSVIGVDRSRAMLDHVPPLPDGWRTEQADARALPYPSSSFDVVTVAYLLHILSETDRASILSEIHRVLCPNGILGVLTPTIPSRGPLRAIAQVLDRLASRAPNRFGGLRALDPRGDLSRAGFEILRSQATARGYIATCTLARRSSTSAAVEAQLTTHLTVRPKSSPPGDGSAFLVCAPSGARCVRPKSVL